MTAFDSRRQECDGEEAHNKGSAKAGPTEGGHSQVRGARNRLHRAQDTLRRVSPAYLTLRAPWTSSDCEKFVKILQSH